MHPRGHRPRVGLLGERSYTQSALAILTIFQSECLRAWAPPLPANFPQVTRPPRDLGLPSSVSGPSGQPQFSLPGLAPLGGFSGGCPTPSSWGWLFQPLSYVSALKTHPQPLQVKSSWPGLTWPPFPPCRWLGLHSTEGTLGPRRHDSEWSHLRAQGIGVPG